MKACLIQPPYSDDPARADEIFAFVLRMLDACDETDDLIVLPEYGDVPVVAHTADEKMRLHRTYAPALLEACAKTARRCGAVVFANALLETPGGVRNTTFCFDRGGEVAGRYFKRHLPPVEREMAGFDSSYVDEPQPPYVLDLDGVRYAFLTCYDFYFYESFARLALEGVDVVIGCSHQRSDTHAALEIMCRHLAYNTCAYVLRSSVSFAEDSTVCGATMAVAPDGTVLANMRGAFGRTEVEFDPKAKYLKPAGFGNPPSRHYEYLEYGRNPWQYRIGGPAMVPGEARMGYPRICAHRGFSTVAPENSMPAFGAAVALGAQEIEFDLWPTSDGEIVSCHDATLDRVSDGTGRIPDRDLAYIRTLDFGSKFSERFRGLRIPLFEDILKKFAGQTVMNIHVKTVSHEYDEGAMRKIVAMIRRWDCAAHCYLMISHDGVVRQFKAYAPDIPICLGHDGPRPMAIVDRAIELGVKKVQLFKPYFDQAMVNKAHAHGIRCNVFFADDPDEARRYLDMGIDTILTNDYLAIKTKVAGLTPQA